MAELFHKTFAVNLSEFDATSASQGTIEQSAAAGLNGTTGGVLCTSTDTTPNLYGVINHALNGFPAFRYAFYLDLANMTIGTNGRTTNLWIAFKPTTSAALGVVRLVLSSGVLKLRFIALDDAGSVAAQTDVGLTSYPAWVEIAIVPESADTAADGQTRFYLGGGDYPALGELVAEFLSQENYTSFHATTFSRVGLSSTGASVGGTLKIDEIIARNDNTPIIYGVEESAGSLRGMRYVLNRRRRKSCYW